jgi:uncharacterized protein (TIGR00369 family)
MPDFEIHDPDFAIRVEESFARQTMMKTIGARLSHIAPGEVKIELPFSTQLSQQHGYLHAAAITAIVDSACGYAALTLTRKGEEVLTIEYKVNFLAPARGELMIGEGHVTRAGRNITVCAGDVFAHSDGAQKQIAVMIATMAVVRNS